MLLLVNDVFILCCSGIYNRDYSDTERTRYHKHARVGTYHNIQATKKGGRQNEHQNDGIVYMHGGTNSADLTLAV